MSLSSIPAAALNVVSEHGGALSRGRRDASIDLNHLRGLPACPPLLSTACGAQLTCSLPVRVDKGAQQFSPPSTPIPTARHPISAHLQALCRKLDAAFPPCMGTHLPGDPSAHKASEEQIFLAAGKPMLAGGSLAEDACSDAKPCTIGSIGYIVLRIKTGCAQHM